MQYDFQDDQRTGISSAATSLLASVSSQYTAVAAVFYLIGSKRSVAQTSIS